MVEVQEDLEVGSSFTRDRFGKSHALKNQDGSLKIISRLKKYGLLVFFIPLILSCPAWALTSEEAGEEFLGRKSTDIRIDSKELQDTYWNQKINPEEKYGLAIDSSTSVGFNEDGDPSMNRRF